MLLSSLVTLPLTGAIIIGSINTYKKDSLTYIKTIALSTSVLNLLLSFIIFILFNSSSNQFQFVQEHYNIQYFDIFLGVDSISIYFVLLTTIIIPIALLSN
jgi:NADH:ubiquinone oxidoreductase subunit 4 (subunit M)